MGRLKILLFLGIIGACSGQDDTNPCLQSFKTGPCRATKYVVKFDQATGSCLPAVYGGCRGNANRFSGITECENVCSEFVKEKFEVARPECSEPPLLSDKSCEGIFPRYRYDVETGRCEPYIYGGCGGSQNLYLTEFDCIRTCIQPDIPDATNIARVDGSNSGEDSSEESSEEDLKIVFPDSLPKPKIGEVLELDIEADVCSLPPILPGPFACKGFSPRWTFSQSEGACVRYIYGGCRGTKNLFVTKEECEKQCPSKPTTKSAQVCSLKIDGGPCRGFKNVFGFDKTTGRCTKFIFGGCQGNENKFLTLEECVSTCGGNTPDLDTDCSAVTCDHSQILFNQAKGCSPITNPGECCPSSWDCSTWEERLRNKDKCFAVSAENPRGKLFKQGEDLETYFKNGCSGCFCEKGFGEFSSYAQPVCAVTDCFFSIPEEGQKCVDQYDHPDSCCPSGQKCNEELDALITCNIDGKAYKEGEKIVSKDNPCEVCLCGPFNKRSCAPMDCGYYQSEKMNRGCVPVFKDGVCCPVDWKCTDEVDLLDNTATTDIDARSVRQEDRCILPVSAEEDCSSPTFRFFFDKASGRCERFEGCAGENTENNFDSQEECNNACKNLLIEGAPVKSQEERQFYPAKDKKCENKVLVGKCRSRLRKYYYDVTTAKCHEFFYSGCQGGENMFDSEQECVSTCVSPSSMLRGRIAAVKNAAPLPEVDVCKLERQAGPCRSMRPRFFYDQDSGECEKFLYGGCQGNGNNFADLSSCQSACKPALLGAPISPFGMGGFPCLGCPSQSEVTPEIKQYARDAVAKLDKTSLGLTLEDTQHCADAVELLQVEDVRTQVVAGTNYFMKLRLESKQGANCDQKREEHVCENIVLFKPLSVNLPEGTPSGYVELSREDQISCSIVLNIPGLPLATRNLDESLNGANSQKSVDDKKPICEQPLDAGFCYALAQRYFFNTQTMKCEIFLYGGCSGNENNFRTEEECLNICQKSAPRGTPNFRELLIPSGETRCVAGNETYAIGDIVRIDSDPCKACVCSTPPEISCFQKKCPLLAPVNRNNNDCKIVKDDLGCCIERLDCPQPDFPIIGGGGGVPGGFSSKPLTPKLKKIAATAAKDHLVSVAQVTGVSCEQAQLIEILDVTSQVVAGTNYKFSMKLRAKSGPMCQDARDRYCKNIKIHEPLSFNCQNSDPLKCLELLNADEIECYETKEELQSTNFPIIGPGGVFLPELKPTELPFLNIGDLLDGGFQRAMPGGVPGGFSGSGITPKLREIAATAAAKHLNNIDMVSGVLCDTVTLVDVLDANSQVVAGTNYKFSLHLMAKTGPSCSDDLDRFCKNIIVHQPLSFRCQESNPLNCLELIRENDIQCYLTKEELLAN